jgi:hypothetical protein
MPRATAVDVLIVSLGSTEGLRRADDELQDSLRRAGASVAIARPFPPAEIPTLMLTDLVWAHAARDSAKKILTQQRRQPAKSEAGLREAPRTARRGDRAVVLPVPVEPSSAPDPSAPATGETVRDIAAITYAANPSKKGLDRVLSAWRQAVAERRDGPPGELLIAGASSDALTRAGAAVPEEDGVRVVGALAPHDYRALLRRARVFVCAPRREDYGIAQLEALADGAQLVTTPAPGPYAALPIARELDSRLVGDDLAAALRAALEDPLPDYTARARQALAPFSREAADRVVAQELLPRLLA